MDETKKGRTRDTEDGPVLEFSGDCILDFSIGFVVDGCYDYRKQKELVNVTLRFPHEKSGRLDAYLLLHPKSTLLY